MTCPICMNSITNICTLPCSHNFCYNCINEWTFTKNNCPICRQSFTSQSHKKDMRFTRSMSKINRLHDLTNELYRLANDINNTEHLDSKIKKINLILKKFYNNPWILKCESKDNQLCNGDCYGCISQKIINNKLNEFIDADWEEGKIWLFKFRELNRI